MKKFAVIIGMILMLSVLFSGCGTDETAASEEPVYVHRPAFTHLDGKNALRFGNVMRTETGYRYAYGYLEMGTVNDNGFDTGMWIVTCGADGCYYSNGAVCGKIPRCVMCFLKFLAAD